ncbi:hypothetical protein PIB30_055607 [Stylosanthes scabra]|uniref:Uncharacterized protein n=1 Tax=Stylosanthes scabra TaxID=79078 RepID=A0ABU6XH16_9FABA|nr:hypothetical protein [Stylosanthes scabra]
MKYRIERPYWLEFKKPTNLALSRKVLQANFIIPSNSTAPPSPTTVFSAFDSNCSKSPLPSIVTIEAAVLAAVSSTTPPSQPPRRLLPQTCVIVVQGRWLTKHLPLGPRERLKFTYCRLDSHYVTLRKRILMDPEEENQGANSSDESEEVLEYIPGAKPIEEEEVPEYIPGEGIADN